MSDGVSRGRSYRHGTDRHSTKPTYTHPLPSRGTIAWKVLEYLADRPGESLNIKRFAKEFNNNHRTGVYNALDGLESSGLIVWDYDELGSGERRRVPGSARISDSGKAFLMGVGVSVDVRGGCRSRVGGLSVHSVLFHFPIDSAELFTPVRLERRWPGRVRTVVLPNFTQYVVSEDDFTLFFNERTVVLGLRSFVDRGSLDLVDARLVLRASEFVSVLRGVGVLVSSLRLEAAHYARVGSWLAASLERLDERFRLKLVDGSFLWIDRSSGPLELESDKVSSLARVEELLSEYVRGSRSWSEVVGVVDDVGLKIDRLVVLGEGLLRLFVEAHKRELLLVSGDVVPLSQKRLDSFVFDKPGGVG